MNRLLEYGEPTRLRPVAARRQRDPGGEREALKAGEVAPFGGTEPLDEESRPTLAGHAGTIYVVDGDPAVRSSLRWLVAHLDVHFEAFARAEDLLALDGLARRCCVVTDVVLPGMSGLDLVRELISRSNGTLPVIVLATHSDIPTAVAALRAGAVDFFEKPFGGRALAQRIEEALRRVGQGQ